MRNIKELLDLEEVLNIGRNRDYERSVNAVKKSFARGSQREVFFSRRWDAVIKKPLKALMRTGETCYNESGRKATIKEWELYESLSERKRKLFPYIALVYDKDKLPCLIMNKVVVDEYFFHEAIREAAAEDKDAQALEELDYDELTAFCDYIREARGIVTDIDDLYELIQENELDDLHYGNIGYRKRDKELMLFDVIYEY